MTRVTDEFFVRLQIDSSQSSAYTQSCLLHACNRQGLYLLRCAPSYQPFSPLSPLSIIFSNMHLMQFSVVAHTAQRKRAYTNGCTVHTFELTLTCMGVHNPQGSGYWPMCVLIPWDHSPNSQETPRILACASLAAIICAPFIGLLGAPSRSATRAWMALLAASACCSFTFISRFIARSACDSRASS